MIQRSSDNPKTADARMNGGPPIDQDILKRTIETIGQRFQTLFDGKTSYLDVYGQAIAILHDEFGEERQNHSLVTVTHRPWYSGIYEADKNSPEDILTWPWRGPSPACSPINLIKQGGVIWTGMTTGKVQYHGDVELLEKQDPNKHVGCASDMRGSEFTIPLYIPTGDGRDIAIASWDEDLNLKYIYGRQPAARNPYVRALAEILRPAGERIIAMKYEGNSPIKPEKAPHLHIKRSIAS
jgi:hypothetical protein